MLNIKERNLQRLLYSEYQRGVDQGIEMMKQKLLHAYENGNLIELEGRAYFLKSDMDNLRDIFEDLEKMNEGGYMI